MQHANILAAESDPHDAEQLERCLEAVGQRFKLALTPEMVLDLLQTEVFDTAVVAAELNVADRPLTACLADWPGVQHIVAIGPSGNWDTERHALAQGAHTYVFRPLRIGDLAAALRVAAPAPAVPRAP